MAHTETHTLILFNGLIFIQVRPRFKKNNHWR